MESDNNEPLRAELANLRSLSRAQLLDGFYQRIEARLHQAKVVTLTDWRRIAVAVIVVVMIVIRKLCGRSTIATLNGSTIRH